MIRSSAVLGAVIALAAVAALVFVGVGVHELSYASAHPHHYGPAKVIAWSAGAGALLAVAVGIVAAALLRTPSGASGAPPRQTR